MRRLLIGSVWAVLLFTIACSEANAPALQSATCVADDDCDTSQRCMAGECVLDGMEDVGQPNAVRPQPDAGLDDVPEEHVEPEPEIGVPCDEGDDYPSGFCIELPGSSTRVCTDFCDPNGADCPEGFACAPPSSVTALRSPDPQPRPRGAVVGSEVVRSYTFGPGKVHLKTPANTSV